MPLFRLKDPMPHLADATFMHDENPDPERYDEVFVVGDEGPEVLAPVQPEPPAAPQPQEA